ncbi:cell wall anchor protein [Salinispora arenicola]|uniref:RCC1 domain-containing protein n=1 Tax=Salinispora arenicola TaxID=168697 RepID=UPI0014314027|nr:RCC1 domain-containing protein [Salinispora arenicola]NIL44150.1 cell wall anchor protein [Salinispora arenicola]
MRRLCRWPGRGAGACRVGRAITGLVFLVLAVMVTQAASMSLAAAENGPSAAIRASDTYFAWGDNSDGQLGNGTITGSSTPVDVYLPAGTTITAVTAGGLHSLALTSTGAVLAWGRNFSGQLGNGDTTNRSTPVDVDLPAGTTITAIAAGAFHSLALTSAGTVLAWGENLHGQLGNGGTTNMSTPVGVSLPAGVTITAVAAGAFHSLAVTSTGAVLAWGDNSNGQLGNGTTTGSSTPVDVDLPAGTTITAVAAGVAGAAHSLALTSTGAALAWGNNADGQLGNGDTTNRSTPVDVDLPAGVTIAAVAAGGLHSLALTAAGAVVAWGRNVSGQLGNGTTTGSSTPVDVDLPTGATITAIAAGFDFGLALTAAGAVVAWGRNASGQLGDGTTTNRSTPVDVDLPASVTITAVAAGGQHSMALAALPTSTTTLQVMPRKPRADQDVTLTATVTCNVDTPTGTITFRTNTTTLATVPLTTSGTATHTTTLPTGTHTLTAHHTSANTCPNSQSPPTTITINPDLPITGPTLTTTTGAATLLTLTGAALIYATRRGRPRHQPD